ncbi:hypothetical protein GCM10020254_54230 [Streptomyces goshikiensis]
MVRRYFREGIWGIGKSDEGGVTVRGPGREAGPPSGFSGLTPTGVVHRPGRLSAAAGSVVP